MNIIKPLPKWHPARFSPWEATQEDYSKYMQKTQIK